MGHPWLCVIDNQFLNSCSAKQKKYLAKKICCFVFGWYTLVFLSLHRGSIFVFGLQIIPAEYCSQEKIVAFSDSHQSNTSTHFIFPIQSIVDKNFATEMNAEIDTPLSLRPSDTSTTF